MLRVSRSGRCRTTKRESQSRTSTFRRSERSSSGGRSGSFTVTRTSRLRNFSASVKKSKVSALTWQRCAAISTWTSQPRELVAQHIRQKTKALDFVSKKRNRIRWPLVDDESLAAHANEQRKRLVPHTFGLLVRARAGEFLESPLQIRSVHDGPAFLSHTGEEDST